MKRSAQLRNEMREFITSMLTWFGEMKCECSCPSLWFRQPCSSSSSMHRLFVKNIMRCSPEMQPLTPEIRGHAVTVWLTMLVNSGFLIETFNFFLVGLALLSTTEAGCEAVTLFHISDHHSFKIIEFVVHSIYPLATRNHFNLLLICLGAIFHHIKAMGFTLQGFFF